MEPETQRNINEFSKVELEEELDATIEQLTILEQDKEELDLEIRHAIVLKFQIQRRLDEMSGDTLFSQTDLAQN